jgi:putative acetyltransferase
MIRQATGNDIAGIAAVFEAAIRQSCSADYTAQQINAWADRKSDYAMWQYKIERDYFLIAEDEWHINGFASIGHKGYLDFLFVHPNNQRKSVAGRLLSQIQSFAAAHGINPISTHASITALPFFIKKGFEIVREDCNIIKGIALKNYLMQLTIA